MQRAAKGSESNSVAHCQKSRTYSTVQRLFWCILSTILSASCCTANEASRLLQWWCSCCWYIALVQTVWCTHSGASDGSTWWMGGTDKEGTCCHLSIHLATPTPIQPIKLNPKDTFWGGRFLLLLSFSIIFIFYFVRELSKIMIDRRMHWQTHSWCWSNQHRLNPLWLWVV